MTIFGPTSNANGALDTNGSLAVTGGELWAVGSSGMAEAPNSTGGQAWLQANVDMRAGDEVIVADGGGSPIATLALAKDAQNIVYSSPTLDAGGTYTVNGTEVAANTATQSTAGRPGDMPNGGPGIPPAHGDLRAAVLPQDRREDA